MWSLLQACTAAENRAWEGQRVGGCHHQRWRCSQKQWGYHCINVVLTDLWMVKDHNCGTYIYMYIYIYMWMGINHENQKTEFPLNLQPCLAAGSVRSDPWHWYKKARRMNFYITMEVDFFRQDVRTWLQKANYPLVNCPITMERSTHFQWLNQLFLWPFSIAFCLT